MSEGGSRSRTASNEGGGGRSHRPRASRIALFCALILASFAPGGRPWSGSSVLAGPYVTATSAIRWNDVAGIRWNDVGGIRWNDVGGIRWNDVGGVRWNDVADEFSANASGLRWNDVGGVRWNDVAGQEFDDAASTGEPVLDLVLLNALSTLPDTSSISVIIVYRAAPSATDFLALGAIGIQGGTVFRRLPMIVVNATKSQIQAIRMLPGVRSVYADRTLSFFDADSRRLIGLDEVESDAELALPGGSPPTGAGVTIAVLDSGVDGSHPDLPFGTKLAQNVRLNGAVGVPVGFVHPVPVEGIVNTDLVLGHGTFVASVAAGSGAASGGRYRGAAPGARILGLSAGDVLIVNMLEGFDYILDHEAQFGVRVVNCSWGSLGWFDPDDPVNIATRALYDAGITVVFAAGNDGPAPDTMNAYAVAPWVIGVGSTRRDGSLSEFSSRGIFEEAVYHPILVAPGEGIIAASPAALAGVNGVFGVADPAAGVQVPVEDQVYYTASSGTSFAAPHVAGVVARLLEQHPALTPSEIKRILQQTATPILGHGRSEVGAGRLDAWAALTFDRDPARPFGTYYPGWLDQRPWRVVHAPALERSGTAVPGTEALVPIEAGAAPVSLQLTLSWGEAPALSDLDITLYDSSGAVLARSEALNFPALFGRAEGVHVLDPPPGSSWLGVGFKEGVGIEPQPFQVRQETATAEVTAYTDVASLDPASRAIVTRAVSRRVLVGQGSRFDADLPLTRADLARALALTAGRPQRIPSMPSFRDVWPSDPAAPYIETVAGARAGRTILAPVIGHMFRPRLAVTRLDFAIAMVRAAGLEDEALRRAGERAGMSDYYYVSSFKRGYMAVALERGLIDPLPSGGSSIFSPGGTVSRLDAARWLLALLDLLN